MKPVVLFGGPARDRKVWREALESAFAENGMAPRLVMDPADADPADVDYVICRDRGTVSSLSEYGGAKAILSLWAGVEWLPRLDPPAGVPVIRMVEDGMTRGMTDYVSAHVLRYHVGLDEAVLRRPESNWGSTQRPLSTQRRVGIAGLGTLGTDAARTLLNVGFRVHGWSRRQKSVEGVVCHAGPEGFETFLENSEILVILLPLTPDTENLFDRDALARLPHGARLINAARGGLIVDDALIEALDANRLDHATLDVFRVEPLPSDHPFRSHPRVTVTPHVASITRPATAAQSIARQIRRGESGLGFENVLDPERGY